MRNSQAQAKDRLKLAYTLSLVIALLMAITSLTGLLFPSGLYPTIELRQAFVANEVANLFIGLPTLLSSMWLAGRGHLAGLLLWPGALLYILYNLSPISLVCRSVGFPYFI